MADEEDEAMARRRARRARRGPESREGALKLPPMQNKPTVHFVEDGEASTAPSTAASAIPSSEEDEVLRRMAGLSASNLSELRPLPEDVIDPTPGSASRKRIEQMAPSVHCADSIYRQDAEGNFVRVNRYAASSQPSAASAPPGSPERARSSGGGSCSSNAPLGGEASNTALGGGDPGIIVAPSLELQLASALYAIIVAPTRFAPCLIAGVGIFEAVVLAQLEAHAAGGSGGGALVGQPISTLILYTTASLHVYRLLLWGALVSCVGVALMMMVRERSSHYSFMPVRKYLDITLLLLYAALTWLVFSDRQLAWTLTSSSTNANLAFFAPTTRDQMEYYVSVLDQLAARSASLTARDMLCVLGAFLSLVPASDEYFRRAPHPYAAAGYGGGGGAQFGAYGSNSGLSPASHSRAAVQPGDGPGAGALHDALGFFPVTHVLLDGYKHVEGGLTLLIGLWSMHSHMALQRPPERAADGGPAFLPLPWRTMKRTVYAGRVCIAMIFLSLDVIVNMLSDTVVWSDRTNQDVVAAIVILVVALIVRVGFFSAAFLTVVGTAHFRLGRYAEVATDFGGMLLISGLSFVALVALRVLRIMRAARSDGTTNANSFWTTDNPLGPTYSAVWAINIILTGLYYVKGVSALRRLASSEYHTHPDEIKRIQRRVNNPYAVGTQMCPI